jgi:hypothetical protein
MNPSELLEALLASRPAVDGEDRVSCNPVTFGKIPGIGMPRKITMWAALPPKQANTEQSP